MLIYQIIKIQYNYHIKMRVNMITLNKIKKYFIRGLIIVLPILITFYILKAIVNFLIQFLYIIQKDFFFLKIYNIPQSQIIVLLLLIIFIGYIIKKLNLESQIFNIEKKLIQKLPIINTIYSGIKKITNLIKKSQNSQTSELIAWVKLPKLNIYCLGFFIGELEQKFSPDTNIKYFSFFIPTTPNPMTGYYIIAAENEFIFNSMTREEAISIIISGGIIRPEVPSDS